MGMRSCQLYVDNVASGEPFMAYLAPADQLPTGALGEYGADTTHVLTAPARVALGAGNHVVAAGQQYALLRPREVPDFFVGQQRWECQRKADGDG